ncbi:SDR family oxidoreductase [Saccharopolyspora sp. 6T]|uniref:SDR family oxidoreductase n=1 Tax=Saccharopolyspora sp. 6T TaxID=2877238 RepID=UPI001CD5EF9C|nr:SDR family oxidoreductase [Saccharopolyspora sp. 6T]MCA1188087.1 SDR family oxidoreductase [Saccharopolyspora sp. 6T]
MRLDGAVAVVTGGGNGIGAALCHRFAGEGASVVVNDLDAAAARSVAAEIGGLAVPGDAGTEDGVAELVGTATERHGRIDLFCANAGVADEGGPEAPEAAWARSMEVNVMAHVRAARALLPQWLERGEGRFLATVSAAGLLTMLGSAPYSVSKHAALAFAEWMAITYADRGIVVQALCPQGVRTDLLDGTGETGRKLLADAAIEPGQVADDVLAALADDRFLVLPHPEVADYYALRSTDPAKWHGGMRKLQRGLDRSAGR